MENKFIRNLHLILVEKFRLKSFLSLTQDYSATSPLTKFSIDSSVVEIVSQFWYISSFRTLRMNFDHNYLSSQIIDFGWQRVMHILCVLTQEYWHVVNCKKARVEKNLIHRINNVFYFVKDEKNKKIKAASSILSRLILNKILIFIYFKYELKFMWTVKWLAFKL